MNDGVDDDTRRSTPARVGVTALNLIAPGLGLARVGKWQEAMLCLAAPFALLVIITFAMGHAPITSYSAVLVALVAILSLGAAIYLVPIILTWRASNLRAPVRGWSRWYGLTAVAVAFMTLSNFAAPALHRFYKPYFAPSESMAPTIAKGDKFIADMRWRGPFARGEIIVFNSPHGLRVSRIVGLPGDHLAMRGGVPVINGAPAPQTYDGRTSFEGYDGIQSAAKLTERLPGEASTHQVLDMGPYPADEIPQITVPMNHVFVLGDNRDRSADSRIMPEFGGVSMVPFDAIAGRPLYIHWSSDHSRIGLRLDT